LVAAIREVHAGRRHLCNSLSRLTIDDYLRTADGHSFDKYESLTARQREVMELVAEGKSSREIAGVLGLSRRTVETHRAAIMKTLGIRRQTELVRYALMRLPLAWNAEFARLTQTPCAESLKPTARPLQ